ELRGKRRAGNGGGRNQQISARKELPASNVPSSWPRKVGDREFLARRRQHIHDRSDETPLPASSSTDPTKAQRFGKRSWIFSGNSATKPFRSIGPASPLSVTAQQQSSSKHSSAHLSFPRNHFRFDRESAHQCGALASLID